MIIQSITMATHTCIIIHYNSSLCLWYSTLQWRHTPSLQHVTVHYNDSLYPYYSSLQYMLIMLMLMLQGITRPYYVCITMLSYSYIARHYVPISSYETWMYSVTILLQDHSRLDYYDSLQSYYSALGHYNTQYLTMCNKAFIKKLQA